MKWTPKKDTIGVPGAGFIMAKDFTVDHLKDLIKRAINRNIPVDVFLNYSLRPAVDGDVYVVDDDGIKEEAKVEQDIEKEEALKEAQSGKKKSKKDEDQA